ncbi:MAG: hypothetical protein NT175_05610 [Bacteroidetes bacterium]|nr:hypothetical protein [Bacteroidota bacterium]
MKKMIFLAVFVLTSLLVMGQDRNIYAEVNGNEVTLWQTNAERNCGALYMMQCTLNDYHLQWLQQDTGLAAFCLCYFDMSVTVGPLSPGIYSADVYHTEISAPDTLFYDGSTSFTISKSALRDTINIIDQYQSDCYGGVGINSDENDGNSRLSQNYPNPFKNATCIQYSSPLNSQQQMFIFNAFGQVVRSFELSGTVRGIIKWDGRDGKGDRLPPGIYYYVLEMDKRAVFKCVLLSGN